MDGAWTLLEPIPETQLPELQTPQIETLESKAPEIQPLESEMLEIQPLEIQPLESETPEGEPAEIVETWTPERIEALTEERREFVNPVDHIFQRPWVQAIQSLAAITAYRDEFCLFEDAQVLRNRRETHSKRLGEVARCALAILERHQDRTTRGVCDGVKDVIFLDRPHSPPTPGILPAAR